MKTMLTICTIFFCISYLYSCSKNINLQCKLNTFKNTDFSEFQNFLISPYAYRANNFINAVDPDGKDHFH